MPTNDMFDDEFKISDTLKSLTMKGEYFDDLYEKDPKVVEANNWSNSSGIAIMTPDILTMENLENRWIEYNNNTKYNRRQSDWKCLELFGMDNYEMYNSLKNKLSKENTNITSNVSDSIIADSETLSAPMNEASVEDNFINSTIDWDDVVETAKMFGVYIMHPYGNPDEIYEKYKSMPNSDKVVSDDILKELIGKTNKEYYLMLKNGTISPIIGDDYSDRIIEYKAITDTVTGMRNYAKSLVENRPVWEAAKYLLSKAREKKVLTEEAITNNIISDAIGDFEALSNNNPEFIYSDYPYISPEDMISMGVYNDDPEQNYYKAISDNKLISDDMTSEDWFEEYKIDDLAYSESFKSNIPNWISKVRELTYSLEKMQESGNYSKEQINSRKQSILELGWNPEIEFSDKARSIAVETAKMRRSSVNIIDLREFDVNYTAPTEEDLNDKELYPIFIVLIAGNAFHSKLIRKFTRDDYSHAAFSLDPELNECFSFKILEANGTKRTGYHREGLKDVFKPNNLNIGLFCFFVPKYIYIKFKDIIKHFDVNMEKTKYSYVSLLCYLLHIPVNVDYKYFCSQFVDVVFRKLDINITGKKSSTFVSPATLHKAALRNEKIFKLYEGSANDYDAEKIKAVINTLKKTAKPLKESEQMYIKNQDMYINYLIENCNKLDTVLSLKEYSSIVTDPTMNNIINKMLFELLDIYSETEMQNGIDIDSLIKKYIKPLC